MADYRPVWAWGDSGKMHCRRWQKHMG